MYVRPVSHSDLSQLPGPHASRLATNQPSDRRPKNQALLGLYLFDSFVDRSQGGAPTTGHAAAAEDLMEEETMCLHRIGRCMFSQSQVIGRTPAVPVGSGCRLALHADSLPTQRLCSPNAQAIPHRREMNMARLRISLIVSLWSARAAQNMSSMSMILPRCAA